MIGATANAGRAGARALAAIAISTALAAGCGGEDLAANPVPLAGDAKPGATAPDYPDPPDASAGPFKRTVMLRNPLSGPANNLLADGDFDFSTEPEGAGGQLGWRGFSGNGQALHPVRTETGGLCRSGLRCGVLEPDMILFGRGAAAAGKGLVASGWAKVPAGADCDAVDWKLVVCDLPAGAKPMKADGPPDAGGWCHYAALLPEKEQAQCIYITSSLPDGATALIDAAVLAPDDGTVTAKQAEIWVPTAEVVAGLEAVQRSIRSGMRFGGLAAAPPADAKRWPRSEE